MPGVDTDTFMQHVLKWCEGRICATLHSIGNTLQYITCCSGKLQDVLPKVVNWIGVQALLSMHAVNANYKWCMSSWHDLLALPPLDAANQFSSYKLGLDAYECRLLLTFLWRGAGGYDSQCCGLLLCRHTCEPVRACCSMQGNALDLLRCD